FRLARAVEHRVADALEDPAAQARVPIDAVGQPMQVLARALQFHAGPSGSDRQWNERTRPPLDQEPARPDSISRVRVILSPTTVPPVSSGISMSIPKSLRLITVVA